MERTLSPEEKIKRAEEIYFRRKMLGEGKKYARADINGNKRDFSILKKMILQILICMVIYSIFYMIKNTEYIFSENIVNKAREILSYDINISKLYEQVKKYITSFTYENEVNEEEQSIEKEQNIKQQENVEETNSINLNNDENNEAIGGENIKEIPEPVALTQMEKDAKDIKDTKSLIVPLEGTITSRFGPRESENPIVSKNHTGIDIATPEGTVFIASMAGIVEKVSNERGIRKSHKNSK